MSTTRKMMEQAHYAKLALQRLKQELDKKTTVEIV